MEDVFITSLIFSAHVRTNVRACRDICPQSPDSWGLPLYYIIRCSFAHALIPFLELLKNMFYNIIVKQRVSPNHQKNFKKSGINIWRICWKPLLLLPLSESNGPPEGYGRGSKSETEASEWLTDWGIEKDFLEKVPQKFGGYTKNSLPLHPLSPQNWKRLEKRSLKDLHNKTK